MGDWLPEPVVVPAGGPGPAGRRAGKLAVHGVPGAAGGPHAGGAGGVGTAAARRRRSGSRWPGGSASCGCSSACSAGPGPRRLDPAGLGRRPAERRVVRRQRARGQRGRARRGRRRGQATRAVVNPGKLGHIGPVSDVARLPPAQNAQFRAPKYGHPANGDPVQNGGSGAMGDQDRQHSVINAGQYRGARPNPGAVRLAGRMGGACSAARPGRRSGLMVSHWEGPAWGRLPAIGPDRAALIDGQVNRDASPRTESPGPSLRRRPQLRASCWRRVLRVGAREGPARTAARAVPAVLAEQDHPGPQGVRWP